MLARQALSSTTIFKYTDGLESLAGHKVATEAVTGSGIQQLQSQIAELQRVLHTHTTTTSQSERNSVSGTNAPTPAEAPFVVATRLKAAVHAKCPYRLGRARCGWAWSAARAVHHLSQLIHFHDLAKSDLAPVCTRCQSAVTDSDSSDDEIARGASLTGGT